MIRFNVPPYTGKEMENVKKAVESMQICGDGEFTKKCNAFLEKQTGAAKCLLTTSCTHALEMAALLCDIKEGDEVIMPSYTFVSTAEPFYAETLAYVQNLRRAGVEARVDVYPGLFHAFDMLLPFLKVSKKAAAAFETRFEYAARHFFAKQAEP